VYALNIIHLPIVLYDETPILEPKAIDDDKSSISFGMLTLSSEAKLRSVSIVSLKPWVLQAFAEVAIAFDILHNSYPAESGRLSYLQTMR